MFPQVTPNGAITMRFMVSQDNRVTELNLFKSFQFKHIKGVSFLRDICNLEKYAKKAAQMIDIQREYRTWNDLNLT